MNTCTEGRSPATARRTLQTLGVTLALSLTAGNALAAKTTKSLNGMWALTQSDYDHPDSAPPYTAEVQKVADARRNAVENEGDVLSEEGKKCLPIGMPGFMANEFALEILETPGRITMLNENSSLPRTIYLNRKKPTEGLEPMWNGYSVGHWEGKTLVITTTNLNEITNPLSFGGGIHAPTTTITEHLYLTDGGDTLVNESTFVDARFLSKPWTTVHHYRRLAEDAELWEYACIIGADGWSERYAGENKEKAEAAAKK
ncbi:MAG: hypothetical protein QM718_11155 [Steroidobacteraceae bacterium]